MRNRTHRLNVRRLFVLGAGASFAASEVKTTDSRHSAFAAPLDADFCKRIADVELKKPAWVGKARDKVGQAWRRDAENRNLGLERAVLLHLSHLEFIQAIHAKRYRDLLSRYEWMKYVSHLSCAVLRRCRQNRARLYDQFAYRAFPEGQALSDLNDRVITFNYDTLLDRILLSRFDQGDLYFDEIRERRDAPRKNGQRNPLLLKLHGSANWRCTGETFRRIIEGPAGGLDETPFEIPEVWLEDKPVPDPDDDDSSPLIVPPLPAKPISSIKLLRYLWTRAYEYLHEAREIVVVGYSLPDADPMAQSMFRNFRAEHLQRVIIVDPSTDVLKKWRSVLRRNGVRATWGYFENFAEYLTKADG